MGLQRLLHLAFPPQCLSCHAVVAEDFALCGSCWRETPFIQGLRCGLCGVPLLGDEHGEAICDDCLTIARPWSIGRAALEYRDNGRKLVLALKHADRLDLAKPAGRWLADAGRDLFCDAAILVPIPVHRFRLLTRRYNQAAVLSQSLSRHTGLPTIPDLLSRQRATATQNGRNREGRFANVADAIVPGPNAQRDIKGRTAILVDDVMTSGATFAVAAEALRKAGAADVRVLALARASKDDYIGPNRHDKD